MTNEDLKKRIEAIALNELLIQFDCGDIVEGGDREACAESIANALIAAGIGDVSEYEDQELSCANSVTDMIAACDKCGLSECIGCEHDYTAAQEVKELALADEVKQHKIDDLEVKCEVLQRDVDNLTRTMEEGGEELAETKHRAEVAERALSICVRSYIGLLTNIKTTNRIFDYLNSKELRVYKKFIDQSEKELAWEFESKEY